MKILYGAIIFAIWSILIGFFVPPLAAYSTVIAAFAAGIYVGYGSKSFDGLRKGAIAGLVGGILSGVIVSYLPNYFANVGGIPLKVYVNEWFTPIIGEISLKLPEFSIFIYLLSVGLVFGSLGGLTSSIRLFRGILLFSTLFILFILYGAVDNMAWNWEKSGWTWYMSFQHVLTNVIDIQVAIVFAFIVIILYYVLE
jgi:hypothetical protein